MGSRRKALAAAAISAACATAVWIAVPALGDESPGGGTGPSATATRLEVRHSDERGAVDARGDSEGGAAENEGENEAENEAENESPAETERHGEPGDEGGDRGPSGHGEPNDDGSSSGPGPSGDD